jgi:MFS family permease
MTTSKTKHTFRAFKNRNYALFFCGQSVSQIGTWMQRTAVSWVVYSMTHSSLMLGFAMFAQQFPSFLLSLFGGIVSDRYSRYKILLVTQTASLIQAALLAALILTGHYTVWEILFLSIILGVINAFDVPARQPMVHDMVSDKEDLPNALALNSAMVNLAFLIGPALSGIVLQKFGAGICFLSNAVSFMAVITSLLLMKLPPFNPPAIKKKVIAELVEGFNYLKHTPSIGNIILILAISGLFVLSYGTLLPVFAKDIFKGNAATFGYINSFMGLGAICGTFFLASLKKGTDLKIILLCSSITLGAGLILFSHTSYLPVAMLFATITGVGTMSQNTVCITIIQVESAAAMRGKMMSYVALAYFGMLPLGSLLIGAVSQKIGAANTMLGEGVVSFIIAAVFFKFLRKDKMNEAHIEELTEAEEMAIEKI